MIKLLPAARRILYVYYSLRLSLHIDSLEQSVFKRFYRLNLTYRVRFQSFLTEIMAIFVTLIL